MNLRQTQLNTIKHIMTRATEAATFFGIIATVYLALLFQWLPISLPETVQDFTLPVVRTLLSTHLDNAKMTRMEQGGTKGQQQRQHEQKHLDETPTSRN